MEEIEGMEGKAIISSGSQNPCEGGYPSHSHIHHVLL